MAADNGPDNDCRSLKEKSARHKDGSTLGQPVTAECQVADMQHCGGKIIDNGQPDQFYVHRFLQALFQFSGKFIKFFGKRRSEF